MEAMKKSTVLLWIRILGALFCTYSLSWILPIGGNLIAINYSVVSVLLAVLFFLFLRRAFNGADRRSVCISVIFGTVFALMLLLGVQMNQSDSLRALKSFRFVPAFIGASLLCTAAVHALLTASARYATGYSEAKEHWFFRADKKMFFLIWAVIFICWIPCFLATYPGVFAYDGVTQIFDVAGGRLSALHPVLHSYFIAGCFAIGALFDSLRAGMAIYSILQMLFFSMTLSFACHAMRRHRMPYWLCVFSVLFFALQPMFPVMAVSSTKDIFFACAIILLCICIWDASSDSKAFFASRAQQVRLVLLTFFVFVTKNNGVFFFLLALPFLIILLRGHRVRFTVLCMIPVALYLIYTGPVYRMLGIAKGNFREALSVPIQQIARTVKVYGDEISEEDYERIYRYIPKDKLQSYQPHISDFVKNYFDTEQLMANKWDFVSLYLKLGIRYPKTYVEAVLSLSLGMWYPDADYQSPNAIYPYWYMEFDNKDFVCAAGDRGPKEFSWPVLQSCYDKLREFFTTERVFLERHSLWPSLENFYRDISMNQAFHRVPVLSMTMSCGFPFWMMLFATALLIYRRAYRGLCPFVFMFAFWVTLCLSPAVIYRYALPLTLSLPLFCAYVFTALRQPAEKKAENVLPNAENALPNV